jgi:hypothetical protein
MNEQQDLESSYSGVSSTVESTTSEKEQSSESEPTSHNITQSNKGDVQGGMQAAGDDSNLLQANTNVHLYISNKEGIGQNTQTEQNEETFSDPTSPYLKDGQLFGFQSDDTPSYSKTLEEENIILVSCFHHSILKAAADALAESLNKVVDKRYLNLDIDNKTSRELDFLKDRELGNKEGSLVVVNSVRTTHFLDWLTTYNDVFAIGNFKNELKTQNRFLICLISSEMLEKALQSKMQERLLFSHWQVPFLPYLMKETFPIHATEIEEKITLQRKRRLWGSSEKEFYKLVYSFTKNGHIFQEVEKREGDNAREILDRERTEASNIFKDDEVLENIVLYVAVFFPELTPNSFDELVSSFMAKDTTFVTVTEVVNESEKTKVVEKQQERLLIDIWKKESDKIKKKCHLKSLKFQGKNRVIDFDSPDLRKYLREYIETEYSTFFRNNFQRVQEIGLLFGKSPRVAENVIRLYADVAESYSQDYGEDWLIQVILRSAKRFGLEVDSHPNQEELLFGKLLELGTLKNELVLSRISSLIREILHYSQLQSMVHNFLDRLISWKYHKAFLAIVECLGSTSQFDQLYWVRQLLERGNQEIIEKANKLMFKFLQDPVINMGKVSVEPLFETDCEVSCRIQEKLLTIKNHVVMALENIGKYRVNGSPNLNVWVEKTLDVVVKPILFEKTYANMLVNFPPIAKEIKDAMIKRAETIGYSIKTITSIPDRQLEPIERFYEINHEVSCQAQEEEVTIKNRVLMTLENDEKYILRGSPDLKRWVEENLNKIIKFVLFNKRYLDVLLDFPPIGEEIQDAIAEQAEAIGYTVKHTAFVPETEPLKLTKDFSLKVEKDNFETKTSQVMVRLEIIVDAKIEDLKKIEGLINSRVDVKYEMQKAVERVARAFLHTIEPERFYMRFEYTDDEHPEEEYSLEEEIENCVKNTLESEPFYANVRSVTPNFLETEITRRYKKLQGENKICPFKFEVVSLKGGEPVTFQGDIQVERVHKDMWLIFQSRKYELEQIKNALENHLKAQLETCSSEVLQYETSEDRERLQSALNTWGNNYTIEQFGLVVSIKNVSRKSTELERIKNEKYQLDLKLEKERLEEQTRKMFAPLLKQLDAPALGKGNEQEIKRIDDKISEPQSSGDVPLVSAVGVDYTKLRDLLVAKNWKEADLETEKRMLEAAGRESQGYLDIEDVENFPCQDLGTIDKLWVKYSDGKFGFSVQKKIYQDLGGTKDYDEKVWESFGDKVGWRKGGSWLSYSDLTFSEKHYIGHLPFRFVCLGVLSLGTLFSRAETCRL